MFPLIRTTLYQSCIPLHASCFRNSCIRAYLYFGLIIVALAGLAGFIAWVMALVRTISMKTWGWFAVVLIFNGLGTLIYAIAGPTNQPAMVAGTAYPPR